MTTTVFNTKVIEVKNKIPDHFIYITTQEFNKLMAENFAARVKQANSVSKTDFDDILISFNRKITSNKTKYLEVLKKLNSLRLKKSSLVSGNRPKKILSLTHQPT